MTGAILLVGFAVEGVTILALHQLLWLHFVVGFLLVGPVALKIGSTFYRFAMYYARAEPYVRRGPPQPLFRILGPLVVLTSIAVIGTGIMLAIVGPGQSGWIFLHKAAFVLWFGVMTVHVLAYLPQLPRLLFGVGAGDTTVPGRSVRYLALAAAIGVGVLVAVVCMQLSGPWPGLQLH